MHAGPRAARVMAAAGPGLGTKTVEIGRENSPIFRFYIFIRKRERKRETTVGKTESVMRDIENGTIRSETYR